MDLPLRRTKRFPNDKRETTWFTFFVARPLSVLWSACWAQPLALV
jgi:hypothetical protein